VELLHIDGWHSTGAVIAEDVVFADELPRRIRRLVEHG
jgi:hypothetical protein